MREASVLILEPFIRKKRYEHEQQHSGSIRPVSSRDVERRIYRDE